MIYKRNNGAGSDNEYQPGNNPSYGSLKGNTSAPYLPASVKPYSKNTMSKPS